jgi:hypothetical protein
MYEAGRVIGVDIDDNLIRTTWRRRRSVWSAQAPASPDTTAATSTLLDSDRGDDSDEPSATGIVSLSRVEVEHDGKPPSPTTATLHDSKKRMVYHYSPCHANTCLVPSPFLPNPSASRIARSSLIMFPSGPPIGSIMRYPRTA